MTLKFFLISVRHDLRTKRKIDLKLIFYSFLFDPSFRLLLNYRIGRYLSSSKYKIVRLLAHIYALKQVTKRNCQISFNATIGSGIQFMHPLGIVIGDGVIIKNNVKIWHQVTIGSHGRKGQEMKYPVINNNVKIYTGAKIIGDLVIGDNAIIGANAVVNRNVPANCIAVGVPARIIPQRK